MADDIAGPAASTPVQTRTTRMRRWRNRAFLLLGSTVATLLLLEVVLRITGLVPPMPYGWVGLHENQPSENFVADPDLGWRMRPSRVFTWEPYGELLSFHSDENGFRVGPVPTASAEAGMSIAVLGDSHSWGHSMNWEDSYSAVLEELLPGSVVRNYAQPGYALDQIWQALRHWALPARPDLVIVGLVEADFSRTLYAYRHREGFNKGMFVVDEGRLRAVEDRDRPSALFEWFDRNSHLWTVLRKSYERLGRHYAIGRWWHLNAAVLDAMREDCARQGTRLLFVRIPLPDEPRFPKLMEYMEATGSEFLDPRDNPPEIPEGLHFPDRHLNVAGHRWVAEAVRDWLREN